MRFHAFRRLLCLIWKRPPTRYRVRQVWRYRHRPVEPLSRVTVLRVDRHPALGVIVHVRLDNLQLRLPHGMVDTLAHLPIAERALDASIIELEYLAPDIPAFEDSYRESARSGEVGIFTVPLAAMLDATEHATPSSP